MLGPSRSLFRLVQAAGPASRSISRATNSIQPRFFKPNVQPHQVWRRGLSTPARSEQANDASVPPVQFETKKSSRSQTPKSALRRVAAVSDHRVVRSKGVLKKLTAYCTAEKYDLQFAAEILRQNGNYVLDPHRTGMLENVLHLRPPLHSIGQEQGDLFVLPSGNIVAWSVPASQVESLAALVRQAAVNPYSKEVETEDLEYLEDTRLQRSKVVGDIIVLGAAPSRNYVVKDEEPKPPPPENLDPATTLSYEADMSEADRLDLTLVKIAFSSGLARSTKLAVLESMLNNYLMTTSNIPTLLSRGSRLPFTRSFILCKTGELLQFRAQLNLYSELTDSLPDFFWDSRHELGLEGYYESVGRALDVTVRIRQLNEKLDYASGIVEVLRERLSEKHSLGLEWMIIVLITVEVGFEVLRLWKEGRAEAREERRYREWKEKKERESDQEYQQWLLTQ